MKSIESDVSMGGLGAVAKALPSDADHERQASGLKLFPTLIRRLRRTLILRIESRWHSLSLARQFTWASSGLVLVGVGILGFWVSYEITHGIKMHVAGRTALYMESFIAPLVQELPVGQPISASVTEEIDLVIARDAPRLRIAAAKIWAPDGRLVYASDKHMVGTQFAMPSGMQRAFKGRMEINFDDEMHPDHAVSFGEYMEIYVPIFHKQTGEVIAVGEFYETTAALENELFRAQLESWAVTALVSLSIIAGLFAIVASGSKTIERQRAALAERIDRLSALLRQNEELRKRVESASKRSAEGVELQLCRLGSDLHDGPAQLLALGLLQLDDLFNGAPGSSKDHEQIRSALTDAMTEIRNISGGLAMPEIRDLPLDDALKLVVQGHERRTSTSVEFSLSGTPIVLSHPLKLCLCRVVQQGLGNAFRHAKGVGQSVSAIWTERVIVIEVSDRGPGFDTTKEQDNRSALGIVGLRSRLESLGGHLSLVSKPGEGTRVIAYLYP